MHYGSSESRLCTKLEELYNKACRTYTEGLDVPWVERITPGGGGRDWSRVSARGKYGRRVFAAARLMGWKGVHPVGQAVWCAVWRKPGAATVPGRAERRRGAVRVNVQCLWKYGAADLTRYQEVLSPPCKELCSPPVVYPSAMDVGYAESPSSAAKALDSEIWHITHSWVSTAAD